jgi:hypothetical protein
MEQYIIRGSVIWAWTPQEAVDKYIQSHFEESRERAMKSEDGKVRFFPKDSAGFMHGVVVDFHV